MNNKIKGRCRKNTYWINKFNELSWYFFRHTIKYYWATCCSGCSGQSACWRVIWINRFGWSNLRFWIRKKCLRHVKNSLNRGFLVRKLKNLLESVFLWYPSNSFLHPPPHLTGKFNENRKTPLNNQKNLKIKESSWK